MCKGGQDPGETLFCCGVVVLALYMCWPCAVLWLCAADAVMILWCAVVLTPQRCGAGPVLALCSGLMLLDGLVLLGWAHVHHVGGWGVAFAGW